jgi:sugar-specific transcriptional regulator TrmB|tara:strand:+ start:2819 stop:3598 length:780 start_codon:yes stop_codon:yes gene_type:complete
LKHLRDFDIIKIMIPQLKQLGLSEKEAKVYLASLELGQATVQEIARKADVNRPTTYVIIETLMKKGLISSFHKGKKQYFLTVDPERLFEIVEDEKRNIEGKKRILKKILPQLKSLNVAKKDRPVVRYYEGKQGIESMIEEFLQTTNDVVRMIYSRDAIESVFNKKEIASWAEQRIKRKIKTKVLYTYRKGSISAPYGNRRKIPLEKFPTSCDIAVYDDKVRIASLGERLTGVIIEDKEIAESIKSIIDLAWDQAEKYQK